MGSWSSEGPSAEEVAVAAGGRVPGGVGEPRQGRCYFWERAGTAAVPAQGWPGRAGSPEPEANRLPPGTGEQAGAAPLGDSAPPAAAARCRASRPEASLGAETQLHPRPLPPTGGARRPRTGKPGAEGAGVRDWPQDWPACRALPAPSWPWPPRQPRGYPPCPPRAVPPLWAAAQVTFSACRSSVLAPGRWMGAGAERAAR